MIAPSEVQTLVKFEFLVTPAEAGVQSALIWIPAFAGMTSNPDFPLQQMQFSAV